MTGVPAEFPDVMKAIEARSGDPSESENTIPFHDPAKDLSERAAAQLWANLNRGRWVYDHTSKRWLNFSGSHWEQDAVRRAFHGIGELCARLARNSKTAEKRSFVLGAEGFAQADTRIGVDSSVWDRDHFLVGTPGRTVDCRAGKLVEPDPVKFISRTTSVEPEIGEPTLWLRCLNEWTQGDQQLIRYLQQIGGYCLTGSTREHVLFFLCGVGKNGKTVFLNTYARILGDYAKTAAMTTFTAARGERHPTDQAMLAGARLVTASETEEGRSWAESTIKQMTGGDPITARFMRGDFFTYQPQFKLLIVGNHQPQLHNVDPAMRRRFNIIEFKHVPPEPDPDLEEKLVAEHGRILNWMIEGCLDWQENGLVRPEAVRRATEEYFNSQDLLGQWLEDRCETGTHSWDLPTALYRDWSEFTRSNGEEPGSAKSFFGNLPKRGFLKGKSNGLRIYRGLKVRPKGGRADD